MDKIVNFLLEYYLWILAVLAISIITTIGIIADSRKKRNKKNMDEVKTTEALPSAESNVNSSSDSSLVEQNLSQLDSVNNNIVGAQDNLQGTDVNEIKPDMGSVSGNIENKNVQNISGLTSTQDMNVKQNMMPNSMSFQPNVNNMVTQPSGNSNVIPGPRPINAVPINQPIQPINNTMQNQIPQQPSVKPLNYVQDNKGSNPLSSQYGNNSSSVNSVNPQQQYNNFVSNVNNAQPIPSQQPSAVVQPMMTSQPSNQVVSQPELSQPTMGLNFVTNENNAPNENDTWNL